MEDDSAVHLEPLELLVELFVRTYSLVGQAVQAVTTATGP